MGGQQDTDFTTLFTRERFFAYDPQDSNITIMGRAPYYERLRRKFDSVLYIGDKIPRLYRHLDFLRAAFPVLQGDSTSCENPVLVAMSWENRARDDNDAWPRKHGYAKAVQEWNHSLSLALQAKEKLGQDIIIVSYERAFISRKGAVLEGFLNVLKLPRPWPKHTHKVMEHSSKKAQAERCIPGGMRTYVEQRADYNMYEKLLNIAL